VDANDVTGNLSQAIVDPQESGRTIFLGKNDVTFDQESSGKVNETFETPANNVTVDVEKAANFDATYDQVEILNETVDVEEPKFEAEPEMAEEEVETRPEDMELKSESSGRTLDMEPDSLNTSAVGIPEIPIDQFEAMEKLQEEGRSSEISLQEFQKMEEKFQLASDQDPVKIPDEISAKQDPPSIIIEPPSPAIPEKSEEIHVQEPEKFPEQLVQNISENLENISGLSGNSENLKNESEPEIIQETCENLKEQFSQESKEEMEAPIDNQEFQEMGIDEPEPASETPQFSNPGILNPFETDEPGFEFKMPDLPKAKTRKSDPFDGVFQKQGGFQDEDFKSSSGCKDYFIFYFLLIFPGFFIFFDF
jgi:hypothetical protein